MPDTPFVLGVLHAVVLAFVAAKVAPLYGRRATPWFVAGLLFSELTLIVLVLRGHATAPPVHVCPACRSPHALDSALSGVRR